MSCILWILTTLVVVEAGTESPVMSAAQLESTVTKADLEQCREQRVDAKECQKWIADNVARHNARMAEEHSSAAQWKPVTKADIEQCRNQRVDAKACHEWIADNKARNNARMAEEHLKPRKVTETDLQRCKENRVDEINCQVWTTEWLARKRLDAKERSASSDTERDSIDAALARLTKDLKRMQNTADEETQEAARLADQDAQKAHDGSSNGKHEAKNKPETPEPAILLSINQPSTLSFSVLVAGMLVCALIAMIVRAKRAHMQQSMKNPLLEEFFAEV